MNLTLLLSLFTLFFFDHCVSSHVTHMGVKGGTYQFYGEKGVDVIIIHKLIKELKSSKLKLAMGTTTHTSLTIAATSVAEISTGSLPLPAASEANNNTTTMAPKQTNMVNPKPHPSPSETEHFQIANDNSTEEVENSQDVESTNQTLQNMGGNNTSENTGINLTNQTLKSEESGVNTTVDNDESTSNSSKTEVATDDHENVVGDLDFNNTEVAGDGVGNLVSVNTTNVTGHSVVLVNVEYTSIMNVDAFDMHKNGFQHFAQFVPSWADWGLLCGNGICDEGEWCRNCPQDCKCDYNCGDNICQSGENKTNCPSDCEFHNGVCGNGICDNTLGMNTYEDEYTCPQDCNLKSVCGDGKCSKAESCFVCEQDCGICEPVCGDGICNNFEYEIDGKKKEGKETCKSCERDCGRCDDSFLEDDNEDDDNCIEKCQNGGRCKDHQCICAGLWTGYACQRKIGDFSIPKNLDATWWKPKKGATWQWQLQGKANYDLDVDIFDIDLDTTAWDINKLHKMERKVVCYFSGGSSENFRGDIEMFPKEALGEILSFNVGDEFPNENWLDIRRVNLFASIMLDRIEKAKSIGCDGIEFDNLDALVHDTKFNDGGRVSLELQLGYNKWLAAQAHARGLAVALKNSNEFTAYLYHTFDMVVNEECFIFHNCDNYWPFLELDKPILNCEYFTSRCMYCERSKAMGISTIKKHPDLTACRKDCDSDFDTKPCEKALRRNNKCYFSKNTDKNECPAKRHAKCEKFWGM